MMIVAIIINYYNIDTGNDYCGKTADEEEDDGGDHDQPAVNSKSHLDENADEDNDDKYQNEDKYHQNYDKYHQNDAKYYQQIR